MEGISNNLSIKIVSIFLLMSVRFNNSLLSLVAITARDSSSASVITSRPSIVKASNGNSTYSNMINGDQATVSLNANVEHTPKSNQTLFRTPKSVRRADPVNERILGTPDYLAPELLCGQGHGPEVDWWVLGVCLYEFMTGIPPFNYETQHKVFENILTRNIGWPQDEEALSKEAVEAVESFLTADPKIRPKAKDVYQMQYFLSVDWENLETIKPPFVPNPDNQTDTGYYEARNTLQHLKLSNIDLEDFK